jgi:[ribosomal protein S18]-alanine N-acetyltransferase
MDFQIRNCVKSDLGQVAKIEKASFDDPYPYELFQTFLEELPAGFRVATGETGFLIGYCVLSNSKEQSTLLISSIAVDPKYRRLGVASALLGDAIKVAREFSDLNTLRKLILQVAVSNTEAQALYRRFGFRAVRKLTNYYGTGRDGVQMEMLLYQDR